MIKRGIFKRQGIYISRPVLNAAAWVAWAEKFGVPNVIPADKMHVTIIASRTDVKCKPQTNLQQAYSDRGTFVMLGLDESVLTFAWHDCYLSDRHYFLLSNGAISDWPEFRLHVTLSYDAKGFEISDEALAAMPPSIILGGEEYGPFDPDAKAKMIAKADDEVIEVTEGDMKAATGLLAKHMEGDTDVADLQTLSNIAGGGSVLKSSLERLAKHADIAAVLKLDDGQEAAAEERAPTGIIKADDESRMVYGFASVSVTKDGAVIDSHKHEITTKALRTLCRGLMKGQRAGKLNHMGTKKTEIVEGLVFDADVWKGMADYFEAIGELDKAQADVFRAMKFEGLLTGFHCEDDKMWEFAKSQDFELSIGASEAHLLELK